MKRLSKGGEAARPAATTAIIRELLPEIERLRAEDKASWQVIAEALASQGLTEGADKKRLSVRRLTSIVTKLRARQKAEAGGLEARAGRVDLASSSDSGTKATAPTNKSKARLAPELTGQPDKPDDEPPLCEAEILEVQRAKHAHLTRKD